MQIDRTNLRVPPVILKQVRDQIDIKRKKILIADGLKRMLKMKTNLSSAHFTYFNDYGRKNYEQKFGKNWYIVLDEEN